MLDGDGVCGELNSKLGAREDAEEAQLEALLSIGRYGWLFVDVKACEAAPSQSKDILLPLQFLPFMIARTRVGEEGWTRVNAVVRRNSGG